MACVAAKYWVRGDDVLVVVMLDQLHRIAAEVVRLPSGEQAVFRSSSLFSLPCTRPEQADSIHRLCQEIDGLSAMIIERAGGGQLSGYPAVQATMRLRTEA